MDGLEAYACAPPKPEYWFDFGYFVGEVIDRYHPYAVEIWNEPDVDPTKMIESHTDYYGGWGGMSVEYAEFVSDVYRHVKPYYSYVTIMAGALMLIGEDQWQFAADLIKYGKFDVLSFHNYTQGREYDTAFAKADRLRTMTDATLWLSETGYQWDDDWGEMPDTFEWEQAFYLKHLVDGALAHDIKSTTWYDHNWRHCNLVEDGRKKLAWYAFEKLVKGESDV